MVLTQRIPADLTSWQGFGTHGFCGPLHRTAPWSQQCPNTSGPEQFDARADENHQDDVELDYMKQPLDLPPEERGIRASVGGRTAVRETGASKRKGQVMWKILFIESDLIHDLGYEDVWNY